MKTKERLAQCLLSAGLTDLAGRASRGEFDDFESESATPQVDLYAELMSRGEKAFADRVVAGEFDSTKEEGDAWMASPEGQAILADLKGGYRG